VPVVRTERRSATGSTVRRVTLPNRTEARTACWHPDRSDRVVQQALRPCWTIFRPVDFHPSSLCYRPGRSAHQAISQKAQLFIRRYQSVFTGMWIWPVQMASTPAWTMT